MKETDRPRIVLHAVEILYSLILLAWFFLPLFILVEGLFPALQLPFRLFPAAGGQRLTLIAAAVLVYLIPAIRLFKIAAVFFASRAPGSADPRRTFPIVLSILSSALVVAAIVLHVVTFAASGRYFLASSPLLYALFLLSLGHNAFFIVFLIIRLNRKDDSYREYMEFKRTGDERAKGLWRLVVRQGIQRRLILSFIGLILVIILVLSYMLMRDFSRTILASVIANGQALAEQAASVVKANFGDSIAINDYFTIATKKNAGSAFRFNALSFYQREGKSESYQVADSTERSLVGSRVQQKGFTLAETTYRYSTEEKVFEFLSPVKISNIPVGYVLVDYARDVIYEPFFRTQIKVILFSGLFLYAAVFLIYIFGRNIVFPILFLRMSVNSISRTLAGMIKGKLRISADALQYQDRVKTRDEIKNLSNEINNMTAVIRGVIPYISASTLKHAEREKPTTEKKELAFLFTDIRGFTTLCEGMSPDKVVEMLNRYLDIQSTVILANGGDIDKFVGDEIMAVFAGPRKELAACKTAMEIRQAMAEERQQRVLADQSVISIGIGVNSGPVVFGSVGAKDRMDFTSIGDTVNLAARLEGANKTYGTKSLITQAVYSMVKEQYLCREIDLLTVKGKSQPARIYEILQERRKAADKLREMKKFFEGGLAFYRKQRWNEAEKAFAFLKAKYRDEASNVFLRRIGLFKRNPPPKDWDGVFALTVK